MLPKGRQRVKQFYSLILLILIFIPTQAWAIHESVQGIHWQECSDKRLKMTFLCGEEWEIQPHDHFLAIRVSIFPMVQLQLERINAPVRYLPQVTKVFLNQTLRYQSGFVMEPFEGKNYAMLKVKAFDSFNSQVRLTDFYFIKDNELYRLSWRAHPQEGWERFQFIAQHVAGSLK
jgi:hypothetical protein